MCHQIIGNLSALWLCSSPEEQPLAALLGLPQDDRSILTSQNVWSQVLPLLLYVIANSIVFFFTLYFRFVTTVLATVFRLVFSRYITCFYQVIIICTKIMSSWHSVLLSLYVVSSSCCSSHVCCKIFGGIEFLVYVASIALAFFVCGEMSVVAVYFVFLCKVFIRNSTLISKRLAQECSLTVVVRFRCLWVTWLRAARKNRVRDRGTNTISSQQLFFSSCLLLLWRHHRSLRCGTMLGKSGHPP